MLSTATSKAAGPEDAYLAARDTAAARIKALSGDASAKLESRTLADLEKKLAAIIGPIRLKGLPQTGKITLETLSDGVGLGLLDGLAFESGDQSRRVVVTTAALTAAWLKAHRTWDAQHPLPDALEESSKTEEFHTQAFGSGVAFVLYGAVPVTSRSGFVQANLFAQSQDGSPPKPDGVIVIMKKDDRVFASQMKLTAPVEPIALCDDLKRKLDSQADVVLKRYSAGASKDQKLFDDYTRRQEVADTEFKRCFAANAAAQRWFRAATADAQSAVDLLTD